MTYAQYILRIRIIIMARAVPTSNLTMPIHVSHSKANLLKFEERQFRSKTEKETSFETVQFWQIILDIALERQFDSAFSGKTLQKLPQTLQTWSEKTNWYLVLIIITNF